MSAIERRDVLVVDDDEGIRALLRAACVGAGLTCDTAGDGEEALEQLRLIQYDVVLTDLRMPRLDGFGLLERSRDLHATRNEQPIMLIMTAYTEEEGLLSVGELASAVIRKPLRATELADIVRSCVVIRQSTGARHRVQGRPSQPAQH